MTGETSGVRGIESVNQANRIEQYRAAIKRLPSLAMVPVRIPVAGGFATKTAAEYVGIISEEIGVSYAGEVNPTPDKPQQSDYPNYPA